MVNVNGKPMNKEQFAEWLQNARLTAEKRKKVQARKKKRAIKK